MSKRLMAKYPQMLRTQRTEFGKQVRKAYEAHQTNLRRSDVREIVPRSDSLANTLTTGICKEMYLLVVDVE